MKNVREQLFGLMSDNLSHVITLDGVRGSGVTTAIVDSIVHMINTKTDITIFVVTVNKKIFRDYIISKIKETPKILVDNIDRIIFDSGVTIFLSSPGSSSNRMRGFTINAAFFDDVQLYENDFTKIVEAILPCMVAPQNRKILVSRMGSRTKN